MEIERVPPMPTRPCRLCLCLQGGAVFADFAVDGQDHLYLVRISFDGFGCCEAPATVTRMPLVDSALLLAAEDPGGANHDAMARALGRYFAENRQALWDDALREHRLLDDRAGR